MKIKYFTLLIAFLFLSGCGTTADDYVGTDATFYDNTFKTYHYDLSIQF